MAEFVQQCIEEMLPELQQMERVGLFSTAETKAILHKRKSYEYKLRRKTKIKGDYLNYVQYEMHVLALVRKRRKKIGYNHKRVEIDVALVQRIHKLFRMVLYRFPSDVKLWLSYLEFSKKRNEKSVVSKTNARMLQIHNRNPDLWILAAKWELEGMQSMENARSLLQRGLRYISDCQRLWIEYFRMELLNVEKLLKRREILGIAGMENKIDEPNDDIMNLKIAWIVFKEASKSENCNSAFLLNFVSICDHFSFAANLQADILKELSIMYTNDENVLATLAGLKLNQNIYSQQELSLGLNVEECCKVFDYAISQNNSILMWSHYLEFLINELSKESTSKFFERKLDKTLLMFAKADENNMISEENFSHWLNILEKVGYVEQMNDVLKSAIVKFPSSGSLWILQLEYVTKIGKDDVQVHFDKALKCVSADYFLKVLDFVLLWCSDFKPIDVISILDKAISLNVHTAAVKERYINIFSTDNDISGIRKLFKKLSATRPVSLNLYKMYIRIEEMQETVNIKKIRAVFEDITTNFGKYDLDVWLDFIKLELNNSKGRPENVGNIYWKAVKSLNSTLVDEFISQYTILKTAN